MNKESTSIYYHDYKYISLVNDVLYDGVEKDDRTGTGTLSYPFLQRRFDLKGMTIPLLTTKKMHVRSIIYEILWYLRGDTNIKYLNDHGVTIWDEWADENGELGPVYGAQWRRWPTYIHADTLPNGKKVFVEGEPIDQIADVIHRLKTNPTDRRIIVNAWNVGQLQDMKLPPCHAMFQFWSDGKELRSHLYQRSCDVGLGVPFNIVQYSILTHMIAHVTGLEATEFVWTGGDVHIYKNHIEPLHTQLCRPPYTSPTLKFARQVPDIDSFEYEDFIIEGYQSHPAIKMEVSV